jgi:hypothetical protein
MLGIKLKGIQMKNEFFSVGDKVRILVGDLQGEIREVVFDEIGFGVNLEDQGDELFYANSEIGKVN